MSLLNKTKSNVYISLNNLPYSLKSPFISDKFVAKDGNCLSSKKKRCVLSAQRQICSEFTNS